MEKYRKKPVEIEAVEVTDEYLDKMNGHILEVTTTTGEEQKVYYYKDHIEIETYEGIMRAEKGHYLIRGVQGEFYPCRYDVFHDTYIKAVNT